MNTPVAVGRDQTNLLERMMPMALFSRVVSKFRRNGSGRVLLIEHHQVRLPHYFERLRVLCHNYAAHALPVHMQFSNHGVGHNGQPLAIYVCPCRHCRCREAWARHCVTGRPFRLWVRNE